jgi:hypothetical protein
MRRASSKSQKPAAKKTNSNKSYVPDSVKPKRSEMSITKQYSVNKRTGAKTLLKGVPLKYKK